MSSGMRMPVKLSVGIRVFQMDMGMQVRREFHRRTPTVSVIVGMSAEGTGIDLMTGCGKH
jgi:hypothetical protein